jgi:cyclophilin family peptidyl-prolyl cis-trans isomerase
VIAGFMAQGGGYAPWGAGTPVAKATHAPIALEVNQGLSNTALSVAMARGQGANTATSQFFINFVDNSGSLDPGAATAGYAVFGSLSAGASVLTAIGAAPCTPLAGFSECVPGPAIVISSATQTR